MNEAALLLALSMIALHVALPAATWALLRRQLDRTLVLWFTAQSIYAGAVLFVFLRPVLPTPVGLLGPHVFATLGFLGMVGALRHELGWRVRWDAQALAWGVWWAGTLPMYLSGRQRDLWIAWLCVWGAAVTGYLLWLVHTLRKRRPTPGLSLMAVGVSLFLVAFVLRAAYVVLTNEAYLLLEGGWANRIFAVAFMLAFVIMVVGGWGFALEKLQAREAQALLAAQAAQRAQDRVDDELRFRDQMLLAQSRFAAVAGLSFFSSALVHEITQPLQTARFALEGALARLGRAQARDASLEGDLRDALAVVGEAGAIAASMRAMIGSGSAAVGGVDVSRALAPVVSVVAAECERRGIAFRYQALAAGVAVQADRVLLMRVALNLAGNALEELVAAGGEGQLAIVLERDDMHVALRFIDNGRGLPAGLDVGGGAAMFVTSKSHGAGVGLHLCHELVRQWGGSLTAGPAHPGDHRPGTCIEVLLPLAPAPAAPAPRGEALHA